MLSSTLRGACAVLALSWLSVGAVQAADRPGAGCTDFRFSADLLKAYPRAPAACQEVLMRDGQRVVRFTAAVQRAAHDHFQIGFLNAVGQPLEGAALTLVAREGQTVEVNGKPIPVKELRRGDKLDFWVPENAAGAYLDRTSKALNSIVLP